VTRSHLAAEAHVLHAAKADKSATEKPDVPAVEAAKLRGGLAHEYSREQRVLRHMTAHPELIRFHILVADDQLVLDVDKGDGGELDHLEALGIIAADSLTIGQDVRRIDGFGVDQWRWRHARGSFL